MKVGPVQIPPHTRFHAEDWQEVVNLCKSTLVSLNAEQSQVARDLENIKRCLFGSGPDLEFDPISLSPRDPFRKKVFIILENKTWVFRSQAAYDAYDSLFEKLGTWGPWTLFRNRGTLYALEEAALQHSDRLNPIEILYFLFHDRERCERIVGFYETSQQKAMKTILPLVGRENPWTVFLDKHAYNIGSRWDDASPYIPGFCKALHLDEKKIRPLLYTNAREGVKAIFEARRKQLKI